MAATLLSTLPKSASVAYPIIKSGVRQGLSTRAIERLVRAAGLPISRARSIVPLARAERALMRAGENIRFIPKGNVIDTRKLPEAISRIGRRFSYTVRLDVILRDGQRSSRFVQVLTDRQDYTPQDIEEDAASFTDDSQRYQIAVLEKATLQEGIKRG